MKQPAKNHKHSAKKQPTKTATSKRSRAYMQYVIAIVWFTIAVGNMFYGSNTVACIFAALGLLQVIVAVVVDVVESRKKRQ